MIKLDGLKLALEIEQNIKKENKNKNIKLDIIQIGNDYASSIYIKRKIQVCKNLNIQTKLWKLKSNISQTKIIQLIEDLNTNPKVNGILLQLPIPKKFNTELILKKINPLKDVDVFNSKTLKLKSKNNESPTPCLVGAINAFIKKYKIPLKNKNIVVIGKGRAGGLPIIKWYKKNYKVIGLDQSSKNIQKYISNADIIISAIGKKNVIDSSKLKKNCAFFDVGINRNNYTKKVVGDINYDIAKKIAKWGTPVPGGIGPLTIVMLITNLIILSKIQHEK